MKKKGKFFAYNIFFFRNNSVLVFCLSACFLCKFASLLNVFTYLQLWVTRKKWENSFSYCKQGLISKITMKYLWLVFTPMIGVLFVLKTILSANIYTCIRMCNLPPFNYCSSYGATVNVRVRSLNTHLSHLIFAHSEARLSLHHSTRQ